MISLKDLNDKLSELNDWAVESSSLVKQFSFESFPDAIEFVKKVADVAQKLNHHPDIFISYNIVRLQLTTHSESGISELDIDLAKEIDKL